MIPRTWSELLDRLACQLGGRSPQFEAEAQEWVRGAVAARYGVDSLRDLDRGRRQVAFQKAAGALLAVEETGMPDVLADDGVPRWLIYRDGSIESAVGQPLRRARVTAAFARYFDGAAVEGPPWRVDEGEDLPTYDEWMAPADFAGAVDASVTG